MGLQYMLMKREARSSKNNKRRAITDGGGGDRMKGLRLDRRPMTTERKQSKSPKGTLWERREGYLFQTPGANKRLARHPPDH